MNFQGIYLISLGASLSPPCTERSSSEGGKEEEDERGTRAMAKTASPSFLSGASRSSGERGERGGRESLPCPLEEEEEEAGFIVFFSARDRNGRGGIEGGRRQSCNVERPHKLTLPRLNSTVYETRNQDRESALFWHCRTYREIGEINGRTPSAYYFLVAI